MWLVQGCSFSGTHNHEPGCPKVRARQSEAQPQTQALLQSQPDGLGALIALIEQQKQVVPDLASVGGISTGVVLKADGEQLEGQFQAPQWPQGPPVTGALDSVCILDPPPIDPGAAYNEMPNEMPTESIELLKRVTVAV